jgi:Protein of unknown function (DUF1236)
MMTNFGPAAIVLALLAGTSSASAQSLRDYDARTVIAQPVPLTQAQRTTIYRTIIPQGRGRQPIIRERIVTEPVAPVVRERVVTGELDAYAYGDGYAYSNGYGYREPYAYRDGYARDAYAYEPRYQRRYVEPNAYAANAFVVGARVPVETRLAPIPPALIADVPAIRSYRYMTLGERVLLVDPDTGVIVADVMR